MADTVMKNAAISGLREQILENAAILFPKIVDEHRRKVFRDSSMEASKPFQIITNLQQGCDSGPMLTVALLTYGDVKDDLLPEVAIYGPHVEDRCGALEGLLRATEFCIARCTHQQQLSEDFSRCAGVDNKLGEYLASEAMIDDRVYCENRQYVIGQGQMAAGRIRRW